MGDLTTNEEMAEKAALEARMVTEFAEVDSNTNEFNVHNNTSAGLHTDIDNNESNININNSDLESDVISQIGVITSQEIQIDNFSDELNSLTFGLKYTTTFTLGGTTDKFCPMTWMHNEGRFNRVVVSRSESDDVSSFTLPDVPPGVYFDLIELCDDWSVEKTGFFRINADEYTQLKCIYVPSDKLFCSLIVPTSIDDYDFINPGFSGFWLRCGLSYTISANSQAIIDNIQYCVNQSLLTEAVFQWDDNRPQCLPPGSITVPATNDDGSYDISWTVSDTPGAGYELYESYGSIGTDERLIYKGSSLNYNVSNRTPGSIFYRVKATRGNYDASLFTTSNACVVTRTVIAPTSIVCPTTSADGIYRVTWNASITPEVSYLIEEHTNATFTSPSLSMTSGTTSIPMFTNHLAGTYYYRVRAIKDSWVNSPWVELNTPIVITKNIPAITNFYVPTTTNSGVIDLTWDASSIPSVQYSIDVSQDPGFTTVDETYNTTSTSISVDRSSETTGVYYFRIRAGRYLWTSSPYVAGANACILTKDIEPPTNIIAPTEVLNTTYNISWTASSTEGVTYQLYFQRPDVSTVWGLVGTTTGTSYTMPAPTENVIHRYRVRAIKTSFVSSSYTTTTNTCSLWHQTPDITGMIVPTTSTGDLIISWDAGELTGTYYVLQESPNSDFSPFYVNKYSGYGTSVTLTDLDHGTFYYRLVASKTGLEESDWLIAANSCVVTRTVEPVTDVIVPISNTTGSITVSYTASPTKSPVVYQLYIGTVGCDDSELSLISAGDGTTLSVTDLTSGVYDVAIKAIRTDWVPSGFIRAANSCTVTRATVAPTDVTLSATVNSSPATVTWTHSTSPNAVYTLVSFFQHSSGSWIIQHTYTTTNNHYDIPMDEYGNWSIMISARVPGWSASNIQTVYTNYIVTNGDIACHIGGYGAGKEYTTKSISTVSTGSNSIQVANLRYTHDLFRAASTSNGDNDTGITLGGQYWRTGFFFNVPSNQSESYIISTGGSKAFTATLPDEVYSHSAISNGTDDIGLYSGGYVQSEGANVNKMYRFTVSTGSSIEHVGLLTTTTSTHSGMHNGIGDIGIFSNGESYYVPYRPIDMPIQKVVVSTSTSAVNLGDVQVLHTTSASFANGVLDQGVIMSIPVDGVYAGCDTKSILLSTGTSAVDSPSLFGNSESACGSNGTGDIGIISGGRSSLDETDSTPTYTVSTIKTYVISTKSDAVSVGSLFEDTYLNSMATNG